eukprot:gene18285-biopygen15969
MEQCRQRVPRQPAIAQILARGWWKQRTTPPFALQTLPVPEANRTEPNRSEPHLTKPSEAKPGQAKPTQPNPTEPSQADLDGP